VLRSLNGNGVGVGVELDLPKHNFCQDQLNLCKMSKAGLKSQLKGLRKEVQKIVHGRIMRTDIPAGMAMAGPPLGPMLGQVLQ